jgi:hypothetical protein
MCLVFENICLQTRDLHSLMLASWAPPSEVAQGGWAAAASVRSPRQMAPFVTWRDGERARVHPLRCVQCRSSGGGRRWDDGRQQCGDAKKFVVVIGGERCHGGRGRGML